MNQLERNVIESFRLAKNDIIKLQNKIIEVGNTQKKIIETLDTLRAREALLSQKVREISFKAAKKPIEKTIVRTIGKKAKKVYVGSKEGKKFHMDNCPFAQNIKPKTKVVFESKTKALNEGYKPCHCIK